MGLKQLENIRESKNSVSEFALGKTNYILIAVAFAVIVLGLALMAGSGSTPDHYNPDIFSWRRIVLAPTLAFAGFVFMVFAIMYKGKNAKNDKEGKA